MGSIKDRNGMDLTEAEDIKRRWQEYTELYKKEIYIYIYSLMKELSLKKQHILYSNQLYDILGK